MINYVIGDATCPIGDGSKIIAHVVNDLGAWGSGFVLAISKKWPHVEMRYRSAARAGDIVLGSTMMVPAELGVTIANMVAQRGLRSRGNPVPLRIKALVSCLASLKSLGASRSIHMPRIGCQRGGSTWDKIEPIVARELDGVDVYVYDLPVKK